VHDDELEEYLEAGRETPSFEVKAAMDWSHAALAKDILALANVADGGVIVVGVKDGSFARQGVTPEIKATYKIDEMRDQVALYADPHVDISVSFPKDKDGREYVAIEVAPFRDVPVICSKDSADTRAGVVYYRNTNRRVESAAVSNSYDMRDIITVATLRTRDRFKSLGVSIEAQSDTLKTQLDEELGEL
jgi:predicted HTH transcriptional regulator